MLCHAMRSNVRPAGKKPAEQSDVEKGGTDQQQKAELKPQILQSGDEKEGSDTMMVSYTDAFRVSNLKVALMQMQPGNYRASLLQQASFQASPLHTPGPTVQLPFHACMVYCMQFPADNPQLPMITKELFVQFDGFLGPKPTPKREEAIKVTVKGGRCSAEGVQRLVALGSHGWDMAVDAARGGMWAGTFQTPTFCRSTQLLVTARRFTLSQPSCGAWLPNYKDSHLCRAPLNALHACFPSQPTRWCPTSLAYPIPLSPVDEAPAPRGLWLDC